ncbi:MAG: transglutaminase family protein [Myxococcota bacterium]
MIRSIAWLAVVSAGAACSRPVRPTSTRLSERFLALAPGLEPSDDARRELDRLSELVRRLLSDVEGHPIDAINRIVFDEAGFVREIDADDVRFMQLSAVISHRRGSCVGLTQLYLALGERLELSLRAVLVPGHVFVRHLDDVGHTNAELLRRGERMPEAWYIEKYAVPMNVDAYLTSLTGDEAVAVVRYNLGNAERKRRNLDAALRHYTAAVRLFDGFPEAHASRGLTFQLRGDLDAAAVAYQRARSLHPTLPGLERNIAALAAEGGAAR